MAKLSLIYDNDKEQSLALKLAFKYSFSLGDFDLWLDGLEECNAKKDIVEYRNKLTTLAIRGLKPEDFEDKVKPILAYLKQAQYTLVNDAKPRAGANSAPPVQMRPFVFDRGGFRNGGQVIVIDFNEAVMARCGKFYSYKEIRDEIIPFEIDYANTNGGKPLFNSLDELIDNPSLVPYNDKKSEQLILCNNFEQEITGAWEVSLLGNTDGLAIALDKLSRGEKANLVSGLILRNEDKFAWLPFSMDITRHSIYERERVSPAANEAPKLVADANKAAAKNFTPLVDVSRFRGAKRRILELWPDIRTLHPHNYDATLVMRVLNGKLEPGEKRYKLKTIQNRLGELQSMGALP